MLGMDDRKKKIIELEKNVKESHVNLNMLLESLGKALINRPEIAEADEKVFSEPGIYEDIAEYRRLLKEIEVSEAAIKDVEIHVARLHELEEDIKSREQNENAQTKELSGFYVILGRLVLEDSGLEDFSVSYRTQADALVPKIQSLEDRLAELTDQAEGGNVFSWIGKSAQGMVLRSFLSKSKDNLERLYRNVGEQFYRLKAESYRLNPESSVEIIDLGDEISKNRSVSAALAGELIKLREERRAIEKEFNASGGPLKRIQSLRKNISNTQNSIKSLYLHFGAIASGEGGTSASRAGEASGSSVDAGQNSPPEKSGAAKKKSRHGGQPSGGLSSLITEAEQGILDDIKLTGESIQEDNTAIEKLRASLAIDEELEKIEKYRRSIAEKKARIAEAEQNIADYENRINSAREHIEELQQLL